MLLPCLLTPLMTNKVVAGVITFILMFLWMAVLNAFIARQWAQKRKMMKKVLLGVVLLTVVPLLLAWFAHATGLVDALWWDRGWAGYDPLTGLFFPGHVGKRSEVAAIEQSPIAGLFFLTYYRPQLS